jgi:hypothetical protein
MTESGNEVVELVARAIGIKMGDYGPDTGWLGPQTHAMGLDIAQAAIAAMPSPWRTIDRPATPESDENKQIAEDWFTWGFQAGLEGAKKARGWQPIVTAPRDGTWIMVGATNLHPCDAYWGWSQVGQTWDWMDNAGLFAAQPTHWMPLPAPPET